jgi:glycosyltransferase involved in cell wall biosynthesis
MKQVKKILIIAPLPPPYNGQSIASETLVKSKISELYNVRTINIGSEGRTGKSGQFEFGRMLQIIKYTLQLFYELVAYKPDLVYITIAQSTLGFLRDFVFIFLISSFKKKCVIHLHGGNFRNFYENSPRFLKSAIRYSLRRVDKVIVLTESLKAIFNGLVEPKKLRVIYNCVQDEYIPSQNEIDLKLQKIAKRRKSDVFKVLYLSNLIPSKGYFDVLQASKIIQKKQLPINFLFAGAWMDQKEKKNAEKFVNKNSLKNVKFLGVITGKSKKELLLECDIFTLPTYYYNEGLPISILEAMAAGLTIITTNYRGISSVVTEGDNGFFVHAKSPLEIAEKIIQIYENPDLQLSIAENNFKKAIAKFTKEKYEQSFINLFEEVLDQQM